MGEGMDERSGVRRGTIFTDAVEGTVAPQHVQRARALAKLLDNALPIPGTGMRVGLDPLLGLVPGLGDLVGAGVSGYILLLAAQAGAPKSVLVRMLGNVALDSLVGSVPALGDLFDFAFKSNARNMQLLERYTEAPVDTQRASKGVVLVIVLLALLIVLGGFLLAFLFARWLVGQLDGSG